MPEINQRIACKAVILYKTGKLLILKEAPTYNEGTNSNRYQLPGGRINSGEPWRQGLKREVREETGLDVEIGQIIGVEEWFPVIQGQKHHIVAMFFLCKPVTDDVTLSDEHSDYEWVMPKDLISYDIVEQENNILKQFFSKKHD